MDLCYGVPRIIAALQHIGKRDYSKIKRRTVGSEGLILREAFPDVHDIRDITEADFTVAADFKPMPV